MIRVVHYCPSINCTSGIANLIMNYYRKIDRSSIQFDFIYFLEKTENNFEKEILELGGITKRITPPSKYFTFRKDMIDFFKEYKTKYQGDIFIFHNHQISFTVLLYGIVKRYLCDRIVVHNHLTKYSDKLISSFRNFLMCIPIKYMKLFYCACSYEASKIIFGKKNEVYIINNGIQINKYLYSDITRKKKRKELIIDDETFLIGCIGRLEYQKNYFKTLKIFKCITEIKNDSKLIIIGKGYLKEKIIKYINENELTDKVIMLENRKDIPELLSAMDVFLFPSKFEGLGIVAIEAESNGLPVFISNMIPKSVNIINCVTIDLKEKESYWAREIIKYNRESITRENCNSIMEKTDFNIDTSVKKLEKIYNKISKDN